MTDVHAKLSPSGAHRWLACAGSAALEAECPDVSSIYADEGTAAHTLAAKCLSGPSNPGAHIGETIMVGERAFKMTQDMAGYVQTYVDLVRQLADGHTLLVEKRVPIEHVTGEPGAGGTSDAIIVNSAGVLTVVDLKYGRGVEVSAESNEQMMLYALGALEDYSVLAEFHTVLMVISQPRISDKPSMWSIPVPDLLRFAEVVAAGADTCRAAEAARANDGIDEQAWAEAYLNPGEKQCRFCNAKASCPALRDEVVDITSAGVATAADFADFVPTEIDETVGVNYLSVAMSKVEMVEMWAKAVRAGMERFLISGGKDPNWKLVAGRAGNRAWRSEDEAEALFKSFRLKIDQMYDFKLISPTKAEKLLKAKPRQWTKVNALITRGEGKPSVAPATDPRPAVSVTATAEDFSEFVTKEHET